MSVIYVDINGTEYGALNKVFNLETRREMYAMGSFWVDLDNQDDAYTDTFSAMDAVDIRIGGKTIMVGFVDDPLIRGGKYSLEKEILKVTGLDHSRELGDLFVTADYSNGLTRMDTQLATIITALVLAGDMSYIHYVLPGAASEPYKPFSYEDTYCLDGFRELMKQGPIADNRLYIIDDLGVAGPRNNLIILNLNIPNYIQSLASVDAASGQKDITVADGSVFSEGDGVYIKDNTPDSENNKIASIVGDVLTMVNDLANTYEVAQVATVFFCLNQVYQKKINTILDVLEYGNGRAANVKNYIQVTGPINYDHWMENVTVDRSTGWVGEALTTLTNGLPPFVLRGTSSIKLTNALAGVYGMELDIAAMTSYDVNGVDISMLTQEVMSYAVYHTGGLGLAGVDMRPRLTDNTGTQIEFYSESTPLWGEVGYTDIIPANIFSVITPPVGGGVEVDPLAGLPLEGRWKHTGAGVFDWGAITKVGFSSVRVMDAGSLYIDCLRLPIPVMGIADEGVYSVGNKRMLPRSMLDCTSQLQIDDYATSELEKQMNLLTDLQLISEGSPSLKYCGYVIKVKKDNSVGAIIDNVDYRLRILIHRYGKKQVEEWTRDHVNELYLIRQDV